MNFKTSVCLQSEIKIKYNADFLVASEEDKLNIFNNVFRLNSIQHKPSSEPVISSTRQGNLGTSWNKKIHHLVQNSQPLVPIQAKLINFNIILPSAPRTSRWLRSFRFQFSQTNRFMYFYSRMCHKLSPRHHPLYTYNKHK